MRHHVQIDTGDHKLLVDGHDISKAVTKLTLTVDAQDLLPELDLRLSNVEIRRYETEDVEVLITDPTRDALIALGWTPPDA